MPAEQATGRPLAANTGWTGLRSALGHDAVLPRVLKPSEPAGVTVGGAVVGPGAGDNAAVALGVGADLGTPSFRLEPLVSPPQLPMCRSRTSPAK